MERRAKVKVGQYNYLLFPLPWQMNQNAQNAAICITKEPNAPNAIARDKLRDKLKKKQINFTECINLSFNGGIVHLRPCEPRQWMHKLFGKQN